MARNANLCNAQAVRNDEFYTDADTIAAELKHYKSFLIGANVYCNCDNPAWSQFYLLLKEYFDYLGLQSLTATYFDPNGSYCTKLTAEGEITYKLQGNGDFRSKECIEILQNADLVITNPPFSSLNDYLLLLLHYKKKFLIIGNINAFTYKDTFPHVRSYQLFLGITKPKKFRLEPFTDKAVNSYKTLGNLCWIQNLAEHERPELPLRFKFNPTTYVTYDNFPDIINVDYCSDIPKDYYGLMGVPISFLEHCNKNQFEIVLLDREMYLQRFGKRSSFYINGKEIYRRVVIRRK